jgi:hypothetical protein
MIAGIHCSGSLFRLLAGLPTGGEKRNCNVSDAYISFSILLIEHEQIMARIGTRQLALLSHNLGSGLHAGLDIRRILETQSQSRSYGSVKHLADVRDRVANGEALASSFKASNGYFPPLFCEMTEVGERTGRLERVFFRLAEHYDQIVRLRRDFIIGITWPLIELGLGIFALGGLIYVLGLIDAEWNGEKISLFGLRGTQGVVIWFGSIALIAAAIALPMIAHFRGWMNIDPLFTNHRHVTLDLVSGNGNGFRSTCRSRRRIGNSQHAKRLLHGSTRKYQIVDSSRCRNA